MNFDLTKVLTEGEHLLVTFNNWMYAKDGQQYKSAWGKCRMLRSKDVFNFDPKNSTNWFMQIGENEDTIWVMGCQIHYVQLCESKPVGTHTLMLG